MNRRAQSGSFIRQAGESGGRGRVGVTGREGELGHILYIFQNKVIKKMCIGLAYKYEQKYHKLIYIYIVTCWKFGSGAT